MNIKFIGQGYNLDTNTSVAAELLSYFQDHAYTNFTCLVAFASVKGVRALSPHVLNSKTHINEFNVIVGIDQNGTSKEALEELLTWDVDVQVYHTTQRLIFHPKIYIFSGDSKSAIIIGSNNLTQMGLAQNIEASIVLNFDNENQKGIAFKDEILAYFAPIINRHEQNLRPFKPSIN